MDCQRQLQLLYDETQSLYLEGFDEFEAYDRLHVDQRFSIIIQLSDIQKLYRKFQEKDQLDEEVARFMKRIDKKRNFLSAEHYMMKLDRQNAKKHLIGIDVKSKFSDLFLKFWQGRYALGFVTTPDLEIHTFEIFDMFHQKLKQVTAPSQGNFVGIHALADPFLLLVEVSPNHATYYVYLVKFEPDDDSMQVLQTIELPNHVQIYVDSVNPKKFIIRKFVLADGINQNFTVQLGKLINGKIELGNEVEYQNGGQLLSYFDGHVYSFVQRRDEDEPIDEQFADEQLLAQRIRALEQMLFGFPLQSANMQNFDLDQGKNTVVAMNAFPENVEETSRSSFDRNCEYAWVRNCCFVSVRFKQSKNYGIAYANAETQNWAVLDLAFKFKIRYLQFNNSDLMVYASEENEDKFEEENGDKNNIKDKVFKFPMRKPDRLRSMAWQKHVKFIKDSTGTEDPHEAALPYLPYNSDVQPFRRIN